MAWRRKVCISFAPSAFTSWPAAASASRSAIGMPSIHSSVSTRRALRVQSTVGHAKAFVVLGVLGNLRDGGGLHAEIHLDGDGLGQSIDHGNRPQAPRRRMEALDHPRGEDIVVEVLLEALLDAGAEHLDGDLF